jgi:exodeoxyribonuclease V alpha subunit
MVEAIAKSMMQKPEPAPEIEVAVLGREVGDLVIQKVNDYDREVFNGDLGVVESIDLEELDVTVRYETRSVTYDLADLTFVIA